MQILAVGFGGALGSVTRFVITKIANQFNIILPFGTLISNIVAALLMGLIIGIERQSQILPENIRLFLTVGCLGGLSTFSTFNIETVFYFENNNYLKGGINILLNLGLTLTFIYLGIILGKLIKS
jgi:CrcB protein